MNNTQSDQHSQDPVNVDHLLKEFKESDLYRLYFEKGDNQMSYVASLHEESRMMKEGKIKRATLNPFLNSEIQKKNIEKLNEKLRASGYFQSEEFKNRSSEAGKKVVSERIDSGILSDHMEKMRSKVTPEGKAKIKEQAIKNLKDSSQTPEHRERCKKMGQEHGGKNGWALLAIPEEKRKENASKAGRIGGKRQMETGTHNFLTKSPNKIKVICPDGHITSKPSATGYCRHRNLDLSKIRVLSEEEYNNLKQ